MPPQNAEEQLLQRRVEELCRAVQFRGQPRYTDFLSDRQQQLAQAALHRAGWSSCRWEGGYPQAERKILCILSDLDAPCEPPIQAVRITPREKSVRLQHRDCLGALLGLGLDRAGLGDLLPEEDGRALYDLWREFEDQKTPEARFARTMDNLQPMMLNHATDGKAWTEHQVSLDQILKRNVNTGKGSEVLWDYAREHFLRPNLEKGRILPSSGRQKN